MTVTFLAQDLWGKSKNVLTFPQEALLEFSITMDIKGLKLSQGYEKNYFSVVEVGAVHF